MKIGNYLVSRTDGGFAFTSAKRAAQLKAEKKQKLDAAQHYFEQRIIEGLSGDRAFNSAKADGKGMTVGPLQIVGRNERESADRLHKGAHLPEFHDGSRIHFSIPREFAQETSPGPAHIMRVKVSMLGVEIMRESTGHQREVIHGKIAVDHEGTYLRYSIDVYENRHPDGGEPFLSADFSSILRRLAKDIRRNFDGILRNGAPQASD